MSMYILPVNVTYSPFTDKIHTIYVLWKKEYFSCVSFVETPHKFITAKLSIRVFSIFISANNTLIQPVERIVLIMMLIVLIIKK